MESKELLNYIVDIDSCPRTCYSLGMSKAIRVVSENWHILVVVMSLNNSVAKFQFLNGPPQFSWS